jgi:Calcineurin-like phosphoesterase
MNMTKLNNNNNNNYKNNLPYAFRISKCISLISIISFLLLVTIYSSSSNITAFGQQSDSQSKDQVINIVVAGDFYCNDETEDTIENIISMNPELIITTGDHVKDVRSIKCWAEMSEPIKDKMKIAIGNHDTEFKKIYKQIVDYHNVKNPYYSHDFQNVHFISMSTEHPFDEGSKQYEFIKNDLEKSSKNQDIDWTIVHSHKPLYSTRNDMEIAEELRNTYHPLFEKYNVDLVISSHNQYYERTYPLLYNSESDEDPIIISHNSESNFYKTDGIIFLTVGTGGDELKDIVDKEDYYIIQNDEEYGFLNLNIENNGKTIVGEFYSNDEDVGIKDHFELSK